MLKDRSTNKYLFSLALLVGLSGLQVSAYEKTDEKPFPEVISFNQLTQDLNRLSIFTKVPIQIPEIGKKIVLVSQPQYLNTSPKKKASKPELPPLSTDSTQINPIDLAAFGFSPSDKASTGALNNRGVLPIPQARTVSPVGEQSSQKPLEAPLKTQGALDNPDVLTGLSPQSTRFGKDRYDKNLFSNPLQNGNTVISQGTGTQGSGAVALRPFSDPSTEGNSFEKDEPEKNPEKEARESFQKTMKEFAERTEDKEAFRLVDYYDLKNILSKNESLLSSFENDEFDDRFIQNAKTIYDRFSEKDSSLDKKPFERFLKRMQPPEIQFDTRGKIRAEKLETHRGRERSTQRDTK